MAELDGFLESLSTSEFRDFLSDVGEVPTAYRRSLGPCPHCQTARGRFVPNMACPNPLCGGTGELFKAYTIPTGNETSGKLVAQNAHVGRTIANVKTEKGDLSCTFFPDDYPMGEGDRLSLASRETQVPQLIERGATGLEDRLKWVPALDIQAVVGPTGEITTDFSLKSDKSALVWTGTGATPAAGTTYSVLYRFYPVWVVPKDTTYRRVKAENGAFFPSRVVLRLFGQNDTDKAAGGLF